MTEWIDLSRGDLEAVQRCARGATGAGSLTDFEHCFGSVAGCGCTGCREERGVRESGARQSDAASGVVDLAGAATSPGKEPTAFADLDEDAAYVAYLRSTGRDPSAMPSLGSGGAEPVPASAEVLRHVVECGQEAEAKLREAGYDPDDLPDRAYTEEWGSDAESLWRQWKALTA